MADAISSVARKVEGGVAKAVAPVAEAAPTPSHSLPTAPHAATIKQVRHATRKMDSAKKVEGAALDHYWQPYIAITAAPIKSGTSSTPTKGTMMVDTGASITLVMKKWAETHGLRISEAEGISIIGANRTPVQMVGKCSATIQLSPTLEVDLADINVSTGDFYQGLLGFDVLHGLHAGGAPILGPAAIQLPGPGVPGHVQWA